LVELSLNTIGNEEDLPHLWFLEAAEQGNPTAQYKIAKMYEDGIGADENLNLAITWYFKSANQGDKAAQSKLVNLFLKDTGGIKETWVCI